MSNKSFANVYRPVLFRDVVGQERVVRILKNCLKSGRVYGSYILEGPYGTGKTTLARIFARGLLCDNPIEGDPCFNCNSCNSFASQNNPNYRELDAATNSGIDSIRKLQEFARMEAWGRSKWKVIVLDEAHNISAPGQDALLKTIEETRDGLVFLLCTTAGGDLLETVRSRSIVCGLEPPSIDSVQKRLEYICTEEKIPCEDLALRLIVARNDSHLRDAIKELEVISSCYPEVTRAAVMDYYGMGDFDKALQFLKALTVNLLQAMDAAYTISTKSSVDHFLHLLQTVLADIFRVKFRHYTDLRLLDPKKDIDVVNAITSALGRRIFLLSQYVIEMRRYHPDLDSLHTIVLYMSCMASQDIVFRTSAVESTTSLKVDETKRSREQIANMLEDPDALYAHGRKQRIRIDSDKPIDKSPSKVLAEKDFIESLWKSPSAPEENQADEAGAGEVTDPLPVDVGDSTMEFEADESDSDNREIAQEVGEIFSEDD